MPPEIDPQAQARRQQHLEAIERFAAEQLARAREAHPGPLSPVGTVTSSWTTDPVPELHEITAVASQLVDAAFAGLPAEEIERIRQDLSPGDLGPGLHLLPETETEVFRRMRAAAAVAIEARMHETAATVSAEEQARRARFLENGLNPDCRPFSGRPQKLTSLTEWHAAHEAERQAKITEAARARTEQEARLAAAPGYMPGHFGIVIPTHPDTWMREQEESRRQAHAARQAGLNNLIEQKRAKGMAPGAF